MNNLIINALLAESDRLMKLNRNPIALNAAQNRDHSNELYMAAMNLFRTEQDVTAQS